MIRYLTIHFYIIGCIIIIINAKFVGIDVMDLIIVKYVRDVIQKNVMIIKWQFKQFKLNIMFSMQFLSSWQMTVLEARNFFPFSHLIKIKIHWIFLLKAVEAEKLNIVSNAQKQSTMQNPHLADIVFDYLELHSSQLRDFAANWVVLKPYFVYFVVYNYSW